MPLHARLEAFRDSPDKRGASRRSVRLSVCASAGGGPGDALIYNLSEQGLLLKAATLLRAGDSLFIDLPRAGTVEAEVVWNRNGLSGCRFATPVSRAAVSAALLVSDPRPRPAPAAARRPEKSGDRRFESRENGEKDWERVALGVSLVLGVATALLFIAALLGFPFAVG